MNRDERAEPRSWDLGLGIAIGLALAVFLYLLARALGPWLYLF